MNQHEYLREIKYGLAKKISEAEIQDIMEEYQGFFVDGLAEGRTEEEISESLGSPAQLVISLLESEYDKSRNYAASTQASNNTYDVINELTNAKTSLPLASLGQRIGATMIDRLLIVIVVILLSFTVGQISSLINRPTHTSYAYSDNNFEDGQMTVWKPAMTKSLILPITLLIFFPPALTGFLYIIVLLKFIPQPVGLANVLSIIIYLLLVIILVFYKPIMESVWHGRTIGKQIMGIRLVSDNGNRAGIGNIWIRELIGDGLLGSLSGGLTSIVSIFTVAIGRPHKSVPDYIASTMVIVDRRKIKLKELKEKD